MATETLGARILDAAGEYADAVQAAYAEWGAGEWTHHHEDATAVGFDKLRALAARADAAERVAVAMDAESLARDAYNAVQESLEADSVKGWGMYQGERELAAYEAACLEQDDAIIAYRARMVQEVGDAG